MERMGLFLERPSRVYWDVKKSNAQNRAAILLTEGGVRLSEPLNNLPSQCLFRMLQGQLTLPSTQFGTPTSSPVGWYLRPPLLSKNHSSILSLPLLSELYMDTK